MIRTMGCTLLAMLAVVLTHTSGEEEGKPRPKSITGAVSKVDATSLTITQRGDSGDRSTTFAVGDKTKVLVQTSEDQSVKGGEGGERKTPKTREGKLADVKADSRVTVTFAEAGKAESILVLRPTPPRKKEGEK